MTWAVMLCVLLGAALLQSGLPGWIWLGGAKWPFLLAATLYYAFTRRPATMLVAAIVGGVLQDALSPLPFGYSAFCLAGVGLLAAAFRPLVLGESVTTQAVFGAVAGAASAMAWYVLLAGRGAVEWPFARALWRVAADGLLGAAATPLTFGAARALDRMVGNVTDEEREAESWYGRRGPA